MRRLGRIAAVVLVLAAVLSPTPSLADSDTQVVITAKGKKYHLQGCRTVKKVYRTLTVSQARKKGYKPCKVCNAPKS